MTSDLYSAASLRTASVSWSGSVELLGLDPEGGPGTGDAGADLDPPLGPDHRGGLAGLQPADLDDRGLHPVRGVAVLEAGGDEQGAVAVRAGGVHRGAGGVVELDRHDHAGQHDEISQEQDG